MRRIPMSVGARVTTGMIKRLQLAGMALAVVAMSSSLGAGVAPADDDTTSASPSASEVADRAQNPASIHGLKWKTEWWGGEPDHLGIRFATAGLSYATAAYSLQNNGFRTVTLRMLADPDLTEINRTRAQRDSEVMKLLRELNRQNINVYLYQRVWLQRDGRLTANADKFVNDMSGIINRAKSEGLTSLQGVMPIETNLENTAQVRERALHIAKGINAKTGNWLKTHTLMVPGAAMGGYFTNIHQGGSRWLADMRGQTSYFAFIYKHMKSQEENRLARYNERWNHYVGLQSTSTAQDQIKFLRQDMGLSDLEYHSRQHKTQFPRHTQVVFWGDAADGVSYLSILGKPHDYTTMRALHTLLVKTNNWRGYFFNFPFTNAAAKGHDLWKYMITVNAQTNERARNTAYNPSRTHQVWGEWQNWANPGFNY
ncbi:MAG: hypothetical protein M3548_17650 [Actinomycetota bacterium]|nr:hypothetical protein [Actinomycetota bacterium]